MRHAEGASAVRSAAKHRSDSVARSTPTQAQRGTRPKKLLIRFIRTNKMQKSTQNIAIFKKVYFLCYYAKYIQPQKMDR
ncbi:MAG: hypothetical protein NZ455_06055 [Bacteroidia bacterium]|nr:hypothetical protein [Bacteroidia bacterium]MDW8345964.1 hypothetical protein [Bacteroidia bacterium]